MHPHLTMITLGVDDLERAVRFYRDGLGLPTQGIVGTGFEHGAVAFFELAGGMALALWPRTSLAHELGCAPATPGTTDFALAHNVTTRDEVDALLAQAQAAGARIVRAAAPAPWGGYTGWFRDPDGHLWEVAWNPQRLPPPA